MKKLTVLPTSRSIRHEILKLQDKNQLIPHYTTISDFLQKVLICDGFSKVDSDIRVLTLLEASDFSSFSSLKIERNFFTFLQNSSYIFRFFEELSAELVNIDELEFADTYAEYAEHIDILKDLYIRYKELCFDRKIADSIFKSEICEINSDYVELIDEIVIIIDGYLTNFEMKILEECCKYTKITLDFKTSSFNEKMQKKLSFNNLTFINNHHYQIDLNEKRIISNKKLELNKNISCEAISQRILQVAFVKERVYNFINSGILAENIAVIVPDESFATFLKEFDHENNFNFAMGISLKEYSLYKSVKAITDYLDNQSVQNRQRLSRYDQTLFDHISKNYLKKISDIEIDRILESFVEFEKNADAKKIIHEEVFRFQAIIKMLYSTTLKSTLHLFLNRLSERSLDDIRGGKISVIGLLETRHISYEGIIVVDFNDSNVPKKSDKDMFLNSAIRERVSLPTTYDRESLQKQYYHSIFSRAKKVAISFVESEVTQPSRFLSELEIISTKTYDESSYAKVLLSQHVREQIKAKEIVSEYDFSTKEISATLLKTYLTCKRKYYYKYIEKLRFHEIEKDLPDEYKIGDILHKALFNVYSKESFFNSAKELKERILFELDSLSQNSELQKFQYHLWAKKLETFVEFEIERFKSGVKVLECEKELKCRFADLNLTGKIDRVDITTNDALEVLDYKSGSYTLYTPRTLHRATDFQLEFYYLLVTSNYKKNTSCSFYDLKTSQIVKETLLEEKIELLQSHLNELRDTKEFTWSMCDDHNNCTYCEYAYLCQRQH